MANQVRAFVSHSSRDREYCRNLVQVLREAGADVWYDEHNLGSGELLDEILMELRSRPIFIVILSSDALASQWVHEECKWAYKLYRRDSNRVILPITAQSYLEEHFDNLLFLDDFRRVEMPIHGPLPQPVAFQQILELLELAPAPASHDGPPLTSDALSDELVSVGESFMDKHRYEDARPYFERAVKLAPANANAWRRLGDSLFRGDRNREALTAYNRCLALTPTNAYAKIRRGESLAHLGRYEDAVRAFEEAIQYCDKPYLHSWACTEKGDALYHLGCLDEALATYDRAIASAGDDEAGPWIGKGRVLFDLWRYDEALAAFERAEKNDPFAWAFDSTLHALTLRSMGRFDDAVRVEEHAKLVDIFRSPIPGGEG